jgi:hypothetical protein
LICGSVSETSLTVGTSKFRAYRIRIFYAFTHLITESDGLNFFFIPAIYLNDTKIIFDDEATS